ncbi:dipeptidase [Aliikangiella sp. IMCC44359]|uniref:dipeptidase n=1 Tax=Aliikangiella sp. IMCC44359 TaxID=3459125 RepID=UPI00403A8177
MKKVPLLTSLLISSLTLATTALANISHTAKQTAEYAVATYQAQIIDSLQKLVQHNTVAKTDTPSPENPVHQAFKQELARQAKQLGLDFTDHGYIVVIGLGNSQERIGMITHGDVQPATPSKWKQSPFDLDLTSEPGKLIGRGTEDDKSTIVNALYAMKSIKDKKVKLKKRIELYIYMAEESDWEPLREFVKQHQLPQINITLDSEYPVVTAEKGFGTILLTFSSDKINSKLPYISSFTGGLFKSQIPEDATVTIENVKQALVDQLKEIALQEKQLNFHFKQNGQQLTIKALGRSAHSSKPEHGINAITYLASLLNFQSWPNNQSGAMVNFINERLGTNLYGENFGDIAYSDSFMGPMTVQPTVIKKSEKGITLSINLRRPVGKTRQQLEKELAQSIKQWEKKNNYHLQQIAFDINEPFVQKDSPQVDTLLAVFSLYTGIKNPKPISIGGGTNSRLFPTAVSFGPTMPGKEYTGHSEHEFITMEQFILNLKMYTAALIELAQ